MRNALAAVTLALGIGAATAMFSLVNPLLHPLMYPRANELVTIGERDPRGNIDPVSFPDFRDWSGQRSALAGAAAFDIGFFYLTGVAEPEQVPGAIVTQNLFRLLGVAPTLGRDFREGEEGVVILSDAAWKRRFGGDRGILGRSIALDFARTTEVERYAVIGVMPPNFWMYYGNFEVFVPLEQKIIRDDRKARQLMAIGRLAPGVSVGQAQSALSAIPLEKDWGVVVREWEESASAPVRIELLVLACGAALLLLIASINAAGLLLVRAQSRRREMAIRAALGASPARLMRLLLGESLRLGVVAAILGVGMAWWCVRALTALMPADIELTRLLPGVDRVSIDMWSLIFAACLGICACLAGGFHPAWNARAVSLMDGLKDSDAVKSLLARKVLIAAEVALSVVLLSGAGLLLKTLVKIRGIDLGFHPENVLILRVPEPRSPGAAPSYYRELSARIAALPGVRAAALMSSVDGRMRDGFEIPGRGEKFSALYQIVEPQYFATLGVRLRRGRFFDDRDERRVVINDAMARRYWPREDPVGARIRLGDETLEIIGVAGDTRPHVFSDPAPLIYRPLRDGRAGQTDVGAGGRRPVGACATRHVGGAGFARRRGRGRHDETFCRR